MERAIDRFDAYMRHVGLNDNKVTIQLGLAVGLIGKSRKEGRDLSRAVIEKIVTYYTDLNSSWLLTGEGSMLNESENPVVKEPQLVADHIPQLSNVEILLRDMLAEKEAKIDALQDRINELIEENARLRTLLEQKGGNAPDAGCSLSASAV